MTSEKIYDTSKNMVAYYEYDSWGKVVGIYDANNKEITSSEHIGKINPIRYRGYYYDEETEFYYVISRYYNPEIYRWISADGQLSSVGGNITGYNLFAYCFNNPINMSDNLGNWPKWLETVAKCVINVIVRSLKDSGSDVAEDIINFDINNESEKKSVRIKLFFSL